MLLLAASLAVTNARADDATDAAWQAVADGEAVVMMRHALAPGGGDPASFDVNDCATQRNLSDEGREQARAIGTALRERLGEGPFEVYSSAWCRCLETARLLGLGEVSAFEPLNSFFQDRGAGPSQTTALREWIDARLAEDDRVPAVLVSHQVNVTGLTGVFPSSGELVIVGPDGEALATALLADP